MRRDKILFLANESINETNKIYFTEVCHRNLFSFTTNKYIEENITIIFFFSVQERSKAAS